MCPMLDIAVISLFPWVGGNKKKINFLVQIPDCSLIKKRYLYHYVVETRKWKPTEYLLT